MFVRDLWWLWEDYNGYGGGSVIKSPRSVLWYQLELKI
jgi:hypothetical protein